MILYVWLLYKSLHDLRIRESIDLSIRKPEWVKRVKKNSWICSVEKKPIILELQSSILKSETVRILESINIYKCAIIRYNVW